jgi:hypothetical protein
MLPEHVALPRQPNVSSLENDACSLSAPGRTRDLGRGVGGQSVPVESILSPASLRRYRTAFWPPGADSVAWPSRGEIPWLRSNIPPLRSADFYGRASNIKLNGVCVALRKCPKPPAVTTSCSRFSPACAPNARPTSWDSEAGVHKRVEAP